MKSRPLAYATLACATLLCSPVLLGCSDSQDATTANQQPVANTATASTVDAQPTAEPVACELVTREEMSSFLGSAVSAEAEERPSNSETTCHYKFAQSLSPDVTFTLKRGHGEAAMMGAGIMGNIEPGIADPYAGLGDQAASVGPELWIRLGEDLVVLRILGVEDRAAVAKQMLDAAQARM